MAESGNNGAAALAASIPIKVENISLPGFGPTNTKAEVFDPAKYRVRYGKFNLDDPAAVAELEIIETKGLRGIDVVVLNKASFTFMDQYQLIVTYLEKITATS